MSKAPTRNREALPKWAQQEIGRLERDLESARAKLRVGPEDSDTFADATLSELARPLGKGARIEFRFGDSWHERITAYIEDRRLVVHGGSVLAVFPRSSNGVEIEVVQ